jgi:hypothetical protein
MTLNNSSNTGCPDRRNCNEKQIHFKHANEPTKHYSKNKKFEGGNLAPLFTQTSTLSLSFSFSFSLSLYLPLSLFLHLMFR